VDTGFPSGIARLKSAPYLIALAIFICSRLIVLLALDYASAHLPLWDAGLWQSGNAWYDHLLRWDSEWYFSIAAGGYHYGGDPHVVQPVVFYPLYPLIARGVAWSTGAGTAVAMLAVANAAAAIAVLLLFRLARQAAGDQAALIAIALFSFYPGALYLSAGYSESVTLVLVLLCFNVLHTRWSALSWICAGLATAARPVGIVLLPVLIWDLWRRGDRRRFALLLVPLIVIATSGLWLYIIYLGAAFGHPLAFAEAQAAFHGDTVLPERVLAALTLQPFRHVDLADVSPYGLDKYAFVALLALSIAAWWRLPRLQALFALGVLALPYLTVAGGPGGLLSMTRYGLLAFPAFVVLGDLGRRAPWLAAAVTGVFGALLALDTALFAQWYWVD
jgi:4-amino-4-deoxy-L-arabinose transferase-like glycosyltransferase